VEDLHNLMLAEGSQTWASVGQTSRIGKAALDPSTDWASIVAGSWDDSQVCNNSCDVDVCINSFLQWIILALWKIADFRAAHGQDISPFMVSCINSTVVERHTEVMHTSECSEPALQSCCKSMG
jgi:hypothetical protein